MYTSSRLLEYARQHGGVDVSASSVVKVQDVVQVRDDVKVEVETTPTDVSFREVVRAVFDFVVRTQGGTEGVQYSQEFPDIIRDTPAGRVGWEVKWVYRQGERHTVQRALTRARAVLDSGTFKALTIVLVYPASVTTRQVSRRLQSFVLAGRPGLNIMAGTVQFRDAALWFTPFCQFETVAGPGRPTSG
jgi:hypothetical protein